MMELEEIEHRHFSKMVELAKTNLRKLTIRELRTLARHYKVPYPEDYIKADLIDEVVHLYVSDAYGME